jgi:hypothetical protein
MCFEATLQRQQHAYVAGSKERDKQEDREGDLQPERSGRHGHSVRFGWLDLVDHFTDCCCHASVLLGARFAGSIGEGQ